MTEMCFWLRFQREGEFFEKDSYLFACGSQPDAWQPSPRFGGNTLAIFTFIVKTIGLVFVTYVYVIFVSSVCNL